MQNVEKGAASVVSAFEDEVVIDSEESIPNFLSYHHCLKKYIFQPSKFDYDTIIEQHMLNNKNYVKKMTWKDFCEKASQLMASYYLSLSTVFKTGFSPQFKRSFCSNVALKLPFCEQKFFKFLKKSSEGKLSPDMSKTVKSFASYAVSK